LLGTQKRFAECGDERTGMLPVANPQ